MREFEERSATLGHQSLVKEATKYAEELYISIQLNYPNPSCYDANGELIPAGEVKAKIKKCLETQLCSIIRDQKWQGKLITKTGRRRFKQKRMLFVAEGVDYMFEKFPESVPHVLTGCPAQAQNKYLSRHNAALTSLFLSYYEI